ncbi:MAG: Cys-tRNA(Pro) deacylase [Lawsonibacter sp.]
MAKQKEEKTNVMRVLEQKEIPYVPHTYEHEEGVAVDGVSVAQSLGQDPEAVFKTLVARGASKGIYVFVIPVAESLDLKKAAKAAGEKSIEMVAVKEITPLTGYVRGGCSPVGMKKQYPTVFHETAEILDSIMVSAGKIGFQVELAPADLIGLVGARTADLTTED